MDRLSQCMKILSWMESHGSITPNEADALCGCKRLAARIADLKKRGNDIYSVMQYYTDADGTKRKYAEYFLEVEDG